MNCNNYIKVVWDNRPQHYEFFVDPDADAALARAREVQASIPKSRLAVFRLPAGVGPHWDRIGVVLGCPDRECRFDEKVMEGQVCVRCRRQRSLTSGRMIRAEVYA